MYNTGKKAQQEKPKQEIKANGKTDATNKQEKNPNEEVKVKGPQ
jgi:hypothetical protein